MSKRGNGIIMPLIGVLFIFAGVAVALLTVSGTIKNITGPELSSAINTYFLGMGIGVILAIIGVVILLFSGKGQ